MAWWLSAWLRGEVSPDDLRTAVIADDAAHDVAGLPGEGEPRPLLLALGVIRALGTRSAGLFQASHTGWSSARTTFSTVIFIVVSGGVAAYTLTSNGTAENRHTEFMAA